MLAIIMFETLHSKIYIGKWREKHAYKLMHQIREIRL